MARPSDDERNELAEPGLASGFFCVLPWINLHVATTGAISPCCEFRGEVANLSDSTLEEAWRSPQLAEVRQAFLEGIPLQACRKCIDREANEGTSFRLQSNARFAGKLRQLAASGQASPPTAAFPTALDLRFSNLCNFKCRSCWHGASSKWFSDAKALGMSVADVAEISSFDTVESFLAQVKPGLTGIEHIYFAGGEPLLQPEHYALLDRLIALGRTDLSLAYNTNMSATSHKDRSIFDLWSQFPNVEVEASVDAAGELGAIIRKGFDWATFAANLGTLRERCPHVVIRFGITVSIMKILALPELFGALARDCGAQLGDFNLHSLQEPVYYRTQVLPQPLKAEAGKRLLQFLSTLPEDDGQNEATIGFRRQIEGLIGYMNALDLSKQLPRMAKVTARLDALRGEKGLPSFFPGFVGR